MKTFASILSAILVSGMMVSAHAAGKLQHVVCFKFKTTATAQDIKQVEVAFEALKRKIPQVVTLEWGTNVSKEKRDKGFTHCFVLSFRSEQDRDTYVEHPEHKAFGKLVGPMLDDVFVIDFWSKP
ncbi:MAG: Dabb family protein [Limisphaerales bacterium]